MYLHHCSTRVQQLRALDTYSSREHPQRVLTASNASSDESAGTARTAHSLAARTRSSEEGKCPPWRARRRCVWLHHTKLRSATCGVVGRGREVRRARAAGLLPRPARLRRLGKERPRLVAKDGIKKGQVSVGVARGPPRLAQKSRLRPRRPPRQPAPGPRRHL